MSYDVGVLDLKSGQKKRRTGLWAGIGVVVAVVVIVLVLIFFTNILGI